MRALITSIGESTTGLCYWALERNGFDVFLLQDSQSSLWAKLKWIYSNTDEDFLRVDADVIVNKNCVPRNIKRDAKDKEIWWTQYRTYDWMQQDITHGGIQFIRKEALPYLRAQIMEAEHKERPESYMYRIKPFHDPRRCVTNETVMGLNGWGQDDIERIKETKRRRMQYDNYDFELAERLDDFMKENK